MRESRLTAKQREEVAKRARYCCEYCCSQEEYSPDPFAVEHITPLAKGGTDDNDNLAFACQGCNNHKYTSIEAFDPATGEFVSLYDPRRDRWEDHFAWSSDHTLIIGLTTIGRATIAKLRLNRSGVIRLRGVLSAANLHPPQST